MSFLGSGAINLGRHIGLQQLEAMAATSHAVLGPNKHYKFIQDEKSGEAAMVCSCYRLLEQLELSGSVGQLLHETTRAHQEALHSGTSTLVFLAGVWSRVALECLHKGIPISHIIAGMSKGLELCVESCSRNAVTLEEMVCKGALVTQQNDDARINAENGLPTKSGMRESTQDTARTINGVLNPGSFKEKHPPKHRIKLKHSRHFNSGSTEAEETQPAETTCQKNSETFDIVQVAEALSHGCMASMNLVLEASRIQCRHGNCGGPCHKVLDVDRLVTCPLPGLSEEHSGVLHGYVVKVGDDHASLVKHFKEQTLKICLVNGDLSEKYRHIGFNRPKNITYIADCSSLTGGSLEAEWVERTLRILLNLSIKVLLVSGVVTGQLRDHCLSHDILVIERVRVTILNDFAVTTGAIPISYIAQLSEKCVGAGVHVKVLREYRDGGKTGSTLLNIVADGTSLVTAVITSSVHAKVQSLEDQFWSCAYRLHHALKDRKLLPGGGAAEMLCVHQLYKHLDMSRFNAARHSDAARTTSPDKQEILQLMADSWIDYISTLMVNAGQVKAKAQAWTCVVQHLKECRNLQRTERPESPLNYYCLNLEQEDKGDMVVGREREKPTVYDNVTVKFEAWRRALDLVFLIIQTDTEIITGMNEEKSQYKDLMFL